MPELPEVEVVRQGITAFLLQQRITAAIVRHPRLRFEIPPQLNTLIKDQPIQAILRRGKYLLFSLPGGTLIWHLGMSGSLRIFPANTPPTKHDHVDLILSNHYILRFNDPRRFGMLLWTKQDPQQHPLLAHLGPEPLSKDFTAAYLAQQAKKRKIAVKVFLMDSKIVVGVGNIYATEALFAAKIHPLTPVHQLRPAHFKLLCQVIKKILRRAISQGGTSLKDFVNAIKNPFKFSKTREIVFINKPIPAI